MPKRLMRTIPKLPFREDPIFGKVVGLECRGLGKLSNSYRESCYGGDELQFRVRSAGHRYSPLGDGAANAELRKLGLSGHREVCSTCFTEYSTAMNCECSDGTAIFHAAPFGDGKVYRRG